MELRGKIYFRGNGRRELMQAAEISGTVPEIEARLVAENGGPCPCCRPAFRGNTGLDADLDTTGRVVWSMSPTLADKIGWGHARHGVRLHPAVLQNPKSSALNALQSRKPRQAETPTEGVFNAAAAEVGLVWYRADRGDPPLSIADLIRIARKQGCV